MSEPTIECVLWDHLTDDEIEGISFRFTIKPDVGEELHYWQDGTENSVSEVPVRRDFIIRRIRHDLRYMPGRRGQAMYVQTLELFVEELPTP